MPLCKHEQLVIRSVEVVGGSAFPVSVYECKDCHQVVPVSEFSHVSAMWNQLNRRLDSIEHRLRERETSFN